MIYTNDLQFRATFIDLINGLPVDFPSCPELNYKRRVSRRSEEICARPDRVNLLFPRFFHAFDVIPRSVQMVQNIRLKRCFTRFVDRYRKRLSSVISLANTLRPSSQESGNVLLSSTFHRRNFLRPLHGILLIRSAEVMGARTRKK